MSRNDDRTFDELIRQLTEREPATPVAVSGELARLTLPRREHGGMPEGWYIIRVELLSGHGEEFAPSPGRDLLVSPHHTFRYGRTTPEG
ncbi:MAG: hypothetical protein WEE66_04055 [Actinomycetota bacterium]